MKKPLWKRASRGTLRGFLYTLLLAVAVLATVVLVFALQARFRLPPLRPWHTIVLQEEFRADGARRPEDFKDYLALEKRLFAELRSKILDDPTAADTQPLGRYNPHTVPAALALATPYNQSFELVPAAPRGAVLLVHGLSDSPYSMRALAETFFAQGYYVLSLRLPGHGTIPSGLVDVTWKDWFAAVTLAAKHAAAAGGAGKPFLAGGHSTGAALITLYCLRAIDDPALPQPQQIYLVSPAIGITPFAALTNVVSGLSFLPYFEKSRWIDVLPEYDPYKYNSFPVNAANQIHTFTRVLNRELVAAQSSGRLSQMPRVHVFQSVVDSTVTAQEVVRGLLTLLPVGGHELVAFDSNRAALLEGLMAPGPLESVTRLRNAASLPFRLVLVTNRSADTEELSAFIRDPGEQELREEPLDYHWPRGVFSLGHVALPFPVDDPVYGLEPAPGVPAYHLGEIDARGESGALLVPLGVFNRLRCNPFFGFVQRTVVESLPQP